MVLDMALLLPHLAINTSMPNKSLLKAESNTFLSKRNILSTKELPESKESHTNKKLLSMKRLFTLKEFPSKKPSPIIMLSKPKSSTFQKKSKKPSLSMNQSKELGREFNIYPLKLKLSTTQREKNTLLAKVSELSMQDTQPAAMFMSNNQPKSLIKPIKALSQPKSPTKLIKTLSQLKLLIKLLDLLLNTDLAQALAHLALPTKPIKAPSPGKLLTKLLAHHLNITHQE